MAAEHGFRRLGLRLVREFVGDRLEAILRRHPLQLGELEGVDVGRRSGGAGVVRGGRGNGHRNLRGDVREKERDHALLGSSLARARRRGRAEGIPERKWVREGRRGRSA